jgi:hypothetical protein
MQRHELTEHEWFRCTVRSRLRSTGRSIKPEVMPAVEHLSP